MTHDDLTPTQIEHMLDLHLVKIVHALHDGISPESIAGLLGVPLWLVQRIGRDALVLDRNNQPK